MSIAAPGWPMVRSAVGARVVEAFTERGELTLPIEPPNGDFRDPAGNVTTPVALRFTQWGRLTLRYGQGRRISIGEPGLFRWSGVVILQLFVRAGTGDADMLALSEKAAAVFTDARLNADGVVRFGVADVVEVGRTGVWFQHNVSTPFTRDRVGVRAS